MKNLIMLIAVLFLTACYDKAVVKKDHLDYLMNVCNNNSDVNRMTFNNYDDGLYSFVVIECNDEAVFTKYFNDVRKSIKKREVENNE